MKRPELLAPAGDLTCLRAAVENGADAVYFGLEDGFNARARATNFQLSNLAEVLTYLHRRNVKGYVTLNTLAFTDELERLEDIIRQIALAGVDAILVQDFGVARLARAVAPTLTLHASTQMTLTSAECIAVAADLGISRVVLPRELSIDEIREIQGSCSIELEVFVHGALCVAYSGQCLTSESMGGRSANRGQCAQACRLPYELLCDGELRDFTDQKYLLSPQDLAAYPLTAELIDAGVSCFKIEGRLKSPEYVAGITRQYREAIDLAMAGRPVMFDRRTEQEMEQSFSRGFSPGWLNGCDHKMLVPATSSAKRGVLLGEVRAVLQDRVRVALQYAVSAGDGVVFEGDRVAGDEQGGRVFDVFKSGEREATRTEVVEGIVELTFDRQAVELHRLRPGQRVWKTDDPKLNRRLRKTFEDADPLRRVGLDLEVVAEVGQPLQMHGRAANGSRCELRSEGTLAAATKHPLTEGLLREQFSRLGGTIYELRSLTARIDGNSMVPLSVLGRLRREMLDQLDASLPSTSATVSVEPVLSSLRPDMSRAETRTSNTITVLCRTLDQLRRVLMTDANEVIADFADPREFREAVVAARDRGKRLYLATTRIQKPGEIGLFHAMLKYKPEAVLARNLSAVSFFREHGVAVAGDYSLNVTNELSAAWLMNLGLDWLTPSYDLNRDQLESLVKVVPPAWLEVVVHQHMPMFHMEHCVFCAMLSPGTNKTNCGRPCDVHQVELRDRTGVDHPLTADIGCRNTLFNAVAQSSAELIPQLVRRGVRRFRIELLRNAAGSEASLVETYRELLNGRTTGREVWSTLNAMNRVGVTRGTLEPRRNPLAIL